MMGNEPMLEKHIYKILAVVDWIIRQPVRNSHDFIVPIYVWTHLAPRDSGGENILRVNRALYFLGSEKGAATQQIYYIYLECRVK